MGQSALCFLAGRSSRFLQLFAVIQSCRGKYSNFSIVLSIFFIRLYKAFGFFLLFDFFNWNIVFEWRKFFPFCSAFFLVSGVCLFMYTQSPFIGCAGSVGIFWRAGSCIYPMCVSLRRVEWRAGTIIFGHFGGVDGGTVRIFLSLWLCSGGYGTVEMVKGDDPFSLCFLQFAVSSLGGWMSAVGFCVIFFVGIFVVLSCGFLFYKLLIVDNLLQVVSQESAP